MKKLFLVLTLCLILSFSSLAEGIDLSSLSPEELQQLVNDASAALDEMNSESEYPRMTVDELFSEYSKNEAAADLYYTNQLIEISDKVYKIEKSGSYYEVGLGDGGIFSNSVICRMKDDQLEKIATLEKNKKTIIRGTCEGDPSWSIIFMDDCEIVEE